MLELGVVRITATCCYRSEAPAGFLGAYQHVVARARDDVTLAERNVACASGEDLTAGSQWGSQLKGLASPPLKKNRDPLKECIHNYCVQVKVATRCPHLSLKIRGWRMASHWLPANEHLVARCASLLRRAAAGTIWTRKKKQKFISNACGQGPLRGRPTETTSLRHPT